MKTVPTVVFLIGLLTPTVVMAAPKEVQPIQIGQETIRYTQGVPTLDLQGKSGAVQVTPLELDHGGLSFSVAVLNDSNQPYNINVTNFTLTSNGQSIEVYTKDQLVKRAKNRAMWTQIALAAVGGIAAAASASQTDTYTSTLYTPRGTYRAISTGPSAYGQVHMAKCKRA